MNLAILYLACFALFLLCTHEKRSDAHRLPLYWAADMAAYIVIMMCPFVCVSAIFGRFIPLFLVAKMPVLWYGLGVCISIVLCVLMYWVNIGYNVYLSKIHKDKSAFIAALLVKSEEQNTVIIRYRDRIEQLLITQKELVKSDMDSRKQLREMETLFEEKDTQPMYYNVWVALQEAVAAGSLLLNGVPVTASHRSSFLGRGDKPYIETNDKNKLYAPYVALYQDGYRLREQMTLSFWLKTIAHPPQNAFDLPQNAFDLPQNAFDLPQNGLDLPQNAPQNAFDLPQNAPQNIGYIYKKVAKGAFEPILPPK